MSGLAQDFVAGHIENRSLSKLWINALFFSHVLDWEE